MSSMSSILNDSDSQCNLDTRSNFFPSGSISLTSKISSNNTPAIVIVFVWCELFDYDLNMTLIFLFFGRNRWLEQLYTLVFERRFNR